MGLGGDPFHFKNFPNMELDAGAIVMSIVYDFFLVRVAMAFPGHSCRRHEEYEYLICNPTHRTRQASFPVATTTTS